MQRRTFLKLTSGIVGTSLISGPAEAVIDLMNLQHDRTNKIVELINLTYTQFIQANLFEVICRFTQTALATSMREALSTLSYRDFQYLVKCNAENNTPLVVANNDLVCDVTWQFNSSIEYRVTCSLNSL